jgi:protein phosphatase
MAPATATIDYAAKTDVGRVRTNNEDSVLTAPPIGLFIVADGMGGHNAGEVASRMAVNVVDSNIRRAVEHKTAEPDKTQVLFGQADAALSEFGNHLVSSIRIANQVIYEASQTQAQNKGMGTTIAAVLARDTAYSIAWVGDSRVYLVRHGVLQQLTTDHSLVQEQVDRGLITSEQAETSDFKNILTRALGNAPAVEPGAVEIEAFDDDYLVLCSDGLTRMVPDRQLLAIVQADRKAADICERLIACALEAGGKDNVTAIVLHRKTERFWDRLLKR